MNISSETIISSIFCLVIIGGFCFTYLSWKKSNPIYKTFYEIIDSIESQEYINLEKTLKELEEIEVDMPFLFACFDFQYNKLLEYTQVNLRNRQNKLKTKHLRKL